MGFLTISNLCITSFLLGLLFTSLLWDSTILWPAAPLTEATVGAVEQYYLTWWNGAMAVKMFVQVMVLVLILGLVVKVAGTSETAYTFGGGSLILVVLTIGLYMAVTLPAMRTIAKDPLFPTGIPNDTNDLFSRIQAYWGLKNSGPLGDIARGHMEAFENLKPMSFQERVEGISVLCASNTIAILLLIGVLALQVGEWYVEETIIKENEKDVAAQRAALAVTAEKKAQ